MSCMKECWIISSYFSHCWSVKFEWVCWHIFGEFVCVCEWGMYESCMCLWVWVQLSGWKLCFLSSFFIFKISFFIFAAHFKSSSHFFALWVLLLPLLLYLFAFTICIYYSYYFFYLCYAFTLLLLFLHTFVCMQCWNCAPFCFNFICFKLVSRFFTFTFFFFFFLENMFVCIIHGFVVVVFWFFVSVWLICCIILSCMYKWVMMIKQAFYSGSLFIFIFLKGRGRGLRFL